MSYEPVAAPGGSTRGGYEPAPLEGEPGGAGGRAQEGGMQIHWNNIAALAYERIAALAYERYVAHMKTNPRFDGKVPATFEELNETEQEAWVHAVMEACDVFSRAMLV